MATTSIVDHPAADPALVESGRGRDAQPDAHRPWLHFLRHLAEMVIAMLAGMLGLGTVINALPGGSALLSSARPERVGDGHEHDDRDVAMDALPRA